MKKNSIPRKRHPRGAAGPACRVLIVVAILGGLSPCAVAQQRGPLAPVPGREVKRIDGPAKVEAPAIPVPELISRFLAREDEISRAHRSYGFHRSIKVQEFPADGSESAAIELKADVFVAENGKQYERVTERSTGFLKASPLTSHDLREVAQISLFPLTSDQAPRYTITYMGAQPLDELHTYVFRVQPKHLERNLRQFEGLVYVDDRDFSIVMIFGRFISEVSDDKETGLPFSTYEIVRESVDGKYWFPTYVRSEDTVKTDKAEARLRLTVRMTGFKAGTSTAPGQVPPPPASPTPRPQS